MSGVDQKLSGTSVNPVEERSIPWSQQVDEAANEIQSPSPNNDSFGNQGLMQFQFPPFYVKENNIIHSNNAGKGHRNYHNNDSKKKFGFQSAPNNPNRDGIQVNSRNSRRFFSENAEPLRNIRNDKDNEQTIIKESRPNEQGDETKLHVVNAVPKKTTWASIASQPAKKPSKTTFTASSNKKKGPGMPPPPMVPGKHNLDINVWDLPNSNPPPIPSPPLIVDISCSEQTLPIMNNEEFGDEDNCLRLPINSNYGKPFNNQHRKNSVAHQPTHQDIRQMSGTPSNHTRRAAPNSTEVKSIERRGNFSGSRNESDKNHKFEYRDENNQYVPQTVFVPKEVSVNRQILLDELKVKNNYNPTEIDIDNAKAARFFVIKSYSEDDIHRSIKYEIWCSTDHGNKRLDDAFKERHKDGGKVLLFFSVNKSGHFCGMAEMMTSVDYNSTSSVWSQDKWKGKFKVKWIYVKDVPNGKLRHIRLENNDNKSVTHSRDTQEIPNSRGIDVLHILHSYRHTTSIFDDFSHYEKKQEEEVSSKRPTIHISESINQLGNKHFVRESDDKNREDNSRESRRLSITMGQKSLFSNNYRDRNSIHKNNSGLGNYHSSYNDYRRDFDCQGTNNVDLTSKEKDIHSDRENNYGHRHVSIRRDEHFHSNLIRAKLNKDIGSDHMQSDIRFEADLSSRDLFKNDEKERMRRNDF